MKYCIECGKQLEENDEYCSCCGSPTDNTKKVTKDEEIDIIPEPLVYNPYEPLETIKYEKTIKLEEEILLIDYFKKTVGTPMQMPYYELVVYEYKDNKLLLEEYVDGGMSNEMCYQYIVDESIYDESMKIINKYGLKKYEGKSGLAPTGISEVIKFAPKRGINEVIRISIENFTNMADYAVFDELRKLLRLYKTDENKV